MLFVGAFLDTGSVLITARAVTSVDEFIGGDCMIALNPSADSALLLNGTVSFDMNCGMSASSASFTGLDISGTAVIDTTGICIAGGASTGGDVTFVIATPQDNCDVPSDPLASLDEPSFTNSCDFTDFTISGSGGTETLTPGVYCNGIIISGNDNDIDFELGTYILAGKGMSVSGTGNNLTGDEVFFYNTDQFGNGDFGDVDFSGNNTVTLSAPTSGDYSGVLFYNDRSDEMAASGKKFKIAAEVSHDLDGAIYYPRNPIEYSGTSSNASGCGAKLIGDTLTFSGTVDLSWNTSPSCASNDVIIGGTPLISLGE